MSSAAGASAPPRSPAAAAPALLGPREPHGEAFASTSAYILGSHWLSPSLKTSPIPKTAPIGITSNPRLLKCGRQLGEEAGSVPALLPSDRCRGPLRKHPIVDHPRAGTAATVTIRILPISLAERRTGMIKKGEKPSHFAFFPPLGSSALWGMRRRRLRLPRPGDGVDDSRGRRGGKRRVHGAVMFVNLKKAMCGQAACSGRQHRLQARSTGTGKGQAAAAFAAASRPGKAR